MLKYFTFILCFTSQIVVAQTTKDSLGMPTFDMQKVGIQEVVKVDSITQKELYGRAKLFFAEKFKSGKDVIQMDDGQGVFLGKGSTEFHGGKGLTAYDVPITFNIKIECKENQYRYTISNVELYIGGIEMYWSKGKRYDGYRTSAGVSLRIIEKLIISSMAVKGW